MIKTKALRKIFITTVTMFVLITVFSLPLLEEEKKELQVNLEVVDYDDIYANNIYLLNDSGYLVRSKILLNEDSLDNNIKKLLNNLVWSKTSKFSNGLMGTIPKGTKIIDVVCGSELVTINFSKEILNVELDKEEIMLSSIVYSLLDIEGVKGVSILVEGKNLEEYPNSKKKLPLVLDKSIGINKKYNIKSRDNISNVIVYYVKDIDNEMYYVPVTKYVNDDRDKIKIIVEELTTSYIYEENLMSFLNSKTKLIDYKEEQDVLFLNFNEYLFDNGDRVSEEVIYSICYSVFDNYDVSAVMIEVNGNNIEQINRNEKYKKST